MRSSPARGGTGASVRSHAANGAPVIRVLLASALPRLRAAVTELLVEGTDLSTAVVAAGSEDLLEKAAVCGVDLLILDLRFPNTTKRQTVKVLKDRLGIPILVLSLSPVVSSSRWREAGASGHLDKRLLADHLVPAVRAISRGRHYFIDHTPTFGSSSSGSHDRSVRAIPASVQFPPTFMLRQEPAERGSR
ncbi:hypothetical protein [Candidatus Nitrospira bockiana]